MRAVITVIGKDMVGILSKVTTLCYESNVNVIEVTQSVLQDLFVMTMMVDMEKCSVPFTELSDRMKQLGEDMGLLIQMMHEDIFHSMHRI